MKRRAFLKLFVGSVAVATLPIPRFLIKKTEEDNISPVAGAFAAYGSDANFTTSGTLTQEMIEDAAIQAALNHGRPDMIYMSRPAYKKFARYFGYKVVYIDDEILHVRF